jgi:peptide/nickel transport system substrate-binding protein
LGIGDLKRNPRLTAIIRFQDLVSVIARDRYTIVFQWKIASEETIMETLHQISPAAFMENPEAVMEWGDVRDWHHAIGTGPFMLKDFVPSESAFLIKNSDYWGHDERYPQNKLPYVDTVRFLIVPDEARALDLMRAGKIDLIDQISPLGAQSLRKTNPEMVQVTHPGANPVTIDPRNDVKPFNDIRVRKAMQMAIDLPSIVREYYHGTVEPYPATFTSRYMREWGFRWEEWPQELKQEYSYDPQAAKKLLAEAGYPHGFKTNIVADKSGEIPLLKIVQSYFAAVGIDMEIRPMEKDDWIMFVMTYHKHDQLASHAGGPLGHNSSPIHDLRIFRKGSRANYNMVDDPVFNDFLPLAESAETFADIQKVMRDANEYVARQHYSISLIQPMAYSFCQPWLKGYNAQFGSAWAHGGGPGLSGFYLSRFWIDSNLKKSTGH